MKRTRFDVDADGFRGAYWSCRNGSSAAMIAFLGDEPEGYMARSGAKWLCRLGLNVMTMAPGKKDHGYHDYPLERIEAAVAWLKAHGNERIGVVGASATGTLALAAASRFPDITFTIALTPSDFIWQGYMKGNRDGCKKWPVDGEALVSYRGEPLPYLPFSYRHPEFWKVAESERRRTGDMATLRKVFDDSEKVCPLAEEHMIKVENIEGKLLLVGAADDALWDTAKYIGRMERRLEEHPHSCRVECAVYKYGTHFVYPETMLRTMLPGLGGAFVRAAFVSARRHPKECRQTREDIDRRVRRAIGEWLQ